MLEVGTHRHGATTPLPPLILRADASAELGAGHVMRCIALAQSWRDSGGMVVLVSAGDLPEALSGRLSKDLDEAVALDVEPGSDSDARATVQVAERVDASWIVADGYAFGERFQAAVRLSGRRLLIVDDYGHAERYHAHIILNQNITATPELYRSREPDTVLLLGTDFILLRREFTSRFAPTRVHPYEATKVLLTFGGSDPYDTAPMVLRALLDIPGDPFEYRVVIGSMSGNFEALARLAKGREVSILRDVTDMPEQLAWADLMIGAAGSTCWEAAHSALPMVLIVVAENQRIVAEKLAACGAAVNLGDRREITPEQLRGTMMSLRTHPAARRMLGATSCQLVDGRGVRRVVATMLDHAS